MSTVEAPWRPVANWAADRVGSIHHDATARAKGFPAGLVPGDIHIALVTAALVHRFGALWYEAGWLRHTFVAPAFNGDEVRPVLEDDDPSTASAVRVRLERRDGTLLCLAAGGVYASAAEGRPPWERPDAPPRRPLGAADPLPHEPVGTEYEAQTVSFTRDDVADSLTGTDDCPWYRTESPWGEPVVPTVGPFNLAHRIRPTPMPRSLAVEMKAGMNAGFEALHLGPIRYGVDYLRRARLVEKGITNRHAFRTVEFSLDDPASATTVFRGRWRIKWVTTTASDASST